MHKEHMKEKKTILMPIKVKSKLFSISSLPR